MNDYPDVQMTIVWLVSLKINNYMHMVFGSLFRFFKQKI